MASTTARLGLTLPDPADTVDVTQLNADFTTIDNTVGFTPCTSTTRPSTPVAGQAIYETDTHNTYLWDAGPAIWRPLPGVTTVFAVGNSGTSLTLNRANGGAQTVTLTGNCTITLAGGTAGQVSNLDLTLTQDTTGSRTVVWPAAVKWAGGVAPTLSTAVGAVDRVVLTTYNGGVTWFGDVRGKAYA
jgi:hypothetical protein